MTFCPTCEVVMDLHYGEEDCYGAGLRAHLATELGQLVGVSCGQPPSDTHVNPSPSGSRGGSDV